MFGLLFLVSGVVLGRVDCSVCRSFVEIAVRLCALNVWATSPSFLVLQEFSLKYRFQVQLCWCCLDVVSLMLLVGAFHFCLYSAHQWLVTLAFGCGLCSTSFSGGHQVDGLPPASSFARRPLLSAKLNV